MKVPTRRQKSVIELLSLGLENKEIAFRLGLTPLTVSAYVSQIYRDFPTMEGRRRGAIRVFVRDHERQMAIRLNVWIRQHGHELSAEGLEGIKGIMADQVAPILRT